MNILEWLTIMGFFVATGSTIIMAQRKAIESLVSKRLDEIQTSVSGLTSTVTEHGHTLTRHETVLEINGLLDRRREAR